MTTDPAGAAAAVGTAAPRDQPEPDSAAPLDAARRGSHVVRGSVWLFVVLGTQSVAGVIFLWLAARQADNRVVGLATALFTGLQYVNYASGLGLDVALARFAARRSHDADALFGWALVATTVGSLAATVVYLLVIVSDATDLVRSPWGWMFFFTLAAGTAVHSLVDVRLMAARRWRWMMGKMGVLSVLRLGLVFVAFDSAKSEALWLLALLALPTALAGVIGIFLLPAAQAGTVRFHRPASLRPARRFAGVNWAAALAFSAPQFTLPVVVTKFVDSAAYANFFLAWSFVQPVFFIPAAIHQVLLLEGSKGEDPAGARRRSLEALALSAGLATGAFLASLLVAPLIPKVFGTGDEYQPAVRLLPALMAGAIPWAISTIRLAEARLRHDHLTTVAITLTFGLGVLGLALLLVPSEGNDGAVKAWLLGNAAAAVISLVLGGARAAIGSDRVAEPAPSSAAGS